VSTRSRQTAWFRGIAAILLAFSLLSNARALVPGMCATLAAARDGAPQESCCSSACRMPGASETDAPREIASTRDKHPACAFCHLAKGFLQAQGYVYCDEPATVAVGLAQHPAGQPISAEARFYGRPRDPPAALHFS